MFISNAEKAETRMAIQSLRAELREALQEVKAMKQAIVELEAIVYTLKTFSNKPQRKKRAPNIRTPEAPYGVKKDGTPKKRPGRTRLVMKTSISAEGAQGAA